MRGCVILSVLGRVQPEPRDLPTWTPSQTHRRLELPGSPAAAEQGTHGSARTRPALGLGVMGSPRPRTRRTGVGIGPAQASRHQWRRAPSPSERSCGCGWRPCGSSSRDGHATFPAERSSVPESGRDLGALRSPGLHLHPRVRRLLSPQFHSAPGSGPRAWASSVEARTIEVGC